MRGVTCGTVEARAGWALVWIALSAACSPGPTSGDSPPESFHVARVVAERPHDASAYTQGLVVDRGVWLESTGRYGASDLREVDPENGRILRRVPLAPHLFGEGLALHGGLLYQLTWREGLCIVYERETLREVRRFRYEGEGWGLASDGRNLFLSNGSSTVRVLDPESFAVLRTFRVTGARGPVDRLNELEFVRGELWANVYQTGWIVRIDPLSGHVRGWIDARALPPEADRWEGQDVLNGIALDPEDGGVWITGKWWKKLYRIETPP